ncbi:Hypothetical predicted protein [Octopus vulgaris]|uniref:Uncharacterized protein n=1 Tax=Octopus vulgaris TaxID=6645 RepID=A0AA36ASI3_OCTVU|nr:Hypothetical predicted protein [Octopus vulgaris]
MVMFGCDAGSFTDAAGVGMVIFSGCIVGTGVIGVSAAVSAVAAASDASPQFCQYSIYYEHLPLLSAHIRVLNVIKIDQRKSCFGKLKSSAQGSSPIQQALFDSAPQFWSDMFQFLTLMLFLHFLQYIYKHKSVTTSSNKIMRRTNQRKRI